MAISEEAERAMEARRCAREDYADTSDNNIVIDDDADVTFTENGAWVAAWLFVSSEEV